MGKICCLAVDEARPLTDLYSRKRPSSNAFVYVLLSCSAYMSARTLLRGAVQPVRSLHGPLHVGCMACNPMQFIRVLTRQTTRAQM